jgi:hypothetical protein
MALDTAVVHPLPPSRSASATVAAGVAAQKREDIKVKELGEECARRSWGYTAFVGETTGAWGQAAQRTVRALVRATSLRTGEEPSQIAPAIWRTLASAVASAVGRQLSRARELSLCPKAEITSSSSSSPGQAGSEAP